MTYCSNRPRPARAGENKRQWAVVPYGEQVDRSLDARVQQQVVGHHVFTQFALRVQRFHLLDQALDPVGCLHGTDGPLEQGPPHAREAIQVRDDGAGYIGWQQDQRPKNLQLAVNNARFLILPWIQSKGLASKTLSRIARQLPSDWHQRHGYSPVLFETFVEPEQHRGTCHRAANWVHVGQTTGRRRKCRVHRQIISIKDIWLYLLRKDFARVLRG